MLNGLTKRDDGPPVAAPAGEAHVAVAAPPLVNDGGVAAAVVVGVGGRRASCKQALLHRPSQGEQARKTSGSFAAAYVNTYRAK